MLRCFFRDESGLTTIEYGLMLSCLGIWCVLALEAVGVVSLED